ncbi:MAG: hypothetical protein H8D80_02695 [Proteobacteria bacterium]|nr:hypothetical protein [Pseudomonadota bacterium]
MSIGNSFAKHLSEITDTGDLDYVDTQLAVIGLANHICLGQVNFNVEEIINDNISKPISEYEFHTPDKKKLCELMETEIRKDMKSSDVERDYRSIMSRRKLSTFKELKEEFGKDNLRIGIVTFPTSIKIFVSMFEWLETSISGRWAFSDFEVIFVKGHGTPNFWNGNAFKLGFSNKEDRDKFHQIFTISNYEFYKQTMDDEFSRIMKGETE